MKRLDIVTYGNPELQTPSEPVKTIDGEIRELVQDMYYTMYREPGVGLAAPQIGVNKRLFVIGFEEAGRKTELVVINPEITAVFGEDEPYEEGCLSVPGISAIVMRPAGIVLEGIDLHGEPVNIRTDGFLARVAQHEYDHLNGVLFVDQLEQDESERVAASLKKLGKKTRKKLGLKG